MSILARSDPAPSDATTAATASIDTYDSEQRVGSMPSFTLCPGGKDRSVITGGVSFRLDLDSIAVNELCRIGWKRAEHATEGDIVVDVGCHDCPLLQCGGHILSNPVKKS